MLIKVSTASGRYSCGQSCSHAASEARAFASTLAKALGLTFQQVQKYEKGANRVSASMLYGISGVLKVDPAFFFEGLPMATETGIKKEVVAVGAIREVSGN